MEGFFVSKTCISSAYKFCGFGFIKDFSELKNICNSVSPHLIAMNCPPLLDVAGVFYYSFFNRKKPLIAVSLQRLMIFEGNELSDLFSKLIFNL